jgi:hypothetical protein
MARPRIIYDNLWGKATALTPSSENSQHPSTDTQIDTLSMYWQASSKTSPANVPMNLGSAKEINFVAILAHNIEPSGVTIKFQGADNSAFSSGLVTRTLTYNATNIFAFITAFTKQYVRLRLEKGTDFTDFPQVATIICGKHFELNRSEGTGFESGPEDPSVVEEGDALVAFTQEKPRIEVGSFPFTGIDDVTKAEILDFIEEVGIHKAFVLCFDYNDPNNESVWVRNAEISRPRWQGVQNCWAWELRIREIK